MAVESRFSKSRHTGQRAAGVLPFALALASFAPGAAWAQNEAQVTARRNLLEQAQQAQTRGDHRTALDDATRAGQIEMTPSVRMFIAQEQAALQMFVEASGTAAICVRDAERDTALRSRDTILANCRGIVAQMQSHIGRLVVNVPPSAPDGTRVTVAGAELVRALYGVDYPVNPGTVVVQVTAPGYETFHREVTVAAGAEVPLGVELHATAVTQPNTAGGGSNTPAGTSAHGDDGGGPGVAPWVVAGAGVLGLGAGAAFFALQYSSASSFEQTYCPGGDNLQCNDTPAARAALDQVHLWNTAGWIAAGAGVALLAGGLAWHFVGGSGGASSARSSARAPGVHWMVVPTQGGAVVGVGGVL